MYFDESIAFGLFIVLASTVAVVGIWRFVLSEMKKSSSQQQR